MVSLKLDVCDSRLEMLRPQLVLKDLTQDLPQVRYSRRSPLARVENTFLAAAAVSAAGYFLLSAGASLAHSVQQNYAAQPLPQTVVIAKTIKRWKSTGTRCGTLGLATAIL